MGGWDWRTRRSWLNNQTTSLAWNAQCLPFLFRYEASCLLETLNQIPTAMWYFVFSTISWLESFPEELRHFELHLWEVEYDYYEGEFWGTLRWFIKQRNQEEMIYWKHNGRLLACPAPQLVFILLRYQHIPDVAISCTLHILHLVGQIYSGSFATCKMLQKR